MRCSVVKIGQVGRDHDRNSLGKLAQGKRAERGGGEDGSSSRTRGRLLVVRRAVTSVSETTMTTAARGCRSTARAFGRRGGRGPWPSWRALFARLRSGAG